MNKGKWTQDKHKAFVAGWEKYGNNWNEVAKNFSTRTPVTMAMAVVMAAPTGIATAAAIAALTAAAFANGVVVVGILQMDIRSYCDSCTDGSGIGKCGGSGGHFAIDIHGNDWKHAMHIIKPKARSLLHVRNRSKATQHTDALKKLFFQELLMGKVLFQKITS